MNYWLDLFNGRTWDEFRAYGSKVTGFNKRFHRTAAKVARGDIFLCYRTKVMLWVGALEVIGPSNDHSAIFTGGEWPLRFDVKPLIQLDAKHGIPMDEFRGKVWFYASDTDRGTYKGFTLRGLNHFPEVNDAELILKMLREAERNPSSRIVDQRKLYPADVKKGKKSVSVPVSIPESSERSDDDSTACVSAVEQKATTRHTEIQHALLSLGGQMGLDLWVARNDRNREWNGVPLGSMPGVITELPVQFPPAAQRTIELIDVLWLDGNEIVAAFEVECTTSVYSGILRMSDLMALQPGLVITLYLVAPDDRRTKVEQEIQRPTFKLRKKPLPSICGFLPFDKLMARVREISKLGLGKALKPEFLQSVAEYFDNNVPD